MAGLAAPAAKLIEAVQSGIGVLYEPTRIRRQALAQADAATTAAYAKVEVRRIKARARRRVEASETRRQQNRESIVEAALRELPGSVDSTQVSPDWIAAFFAACQDVSDEQMQSLWARLLAGEVAHPGSFSPRTIEAVRLMSKQEAELFHSVTRFFFSTESRLVFLPATENSEQYVAEHHQVTDHALRHLVSVGLLEEPELQLNFKATNPISCAYGPRRFEFAVPPEAFKTGGFQLKRFSVRIRTLTLIGRELAPLARADAAIDLGFLDCVLGSVGEEGGLVQHDHSREDAEAV